MGESDPCHHITKYNPPPFPPPCAVLKALPRNSRSLTKQHRAVRVMSPLSKCVFSVKLSWPPGSMRLQTAASLQIAAPRALPRWEGRSCCSSCCGLCELQSPLRALLSAIFTPSVMPSWPHRSFFVHVQLYLTFNPSVATIKNTSL